MGINLSMGGGETLENTELQQGVEPSMQKKHVKYLLSLWYKDIVEYILTLRCPPNYDKAKYRTLRLRSQKYIVENGRLYWKDPVGILPLCLTEQEVDQVMNEFHKGMCCGHYSWQSTAHKILRASFF